MEDNDNDNPQNLDQELNTNSGTDNFIYEPSEKLNSIFESTKFKFDDFKSNNKEDIEKAITKTYNDWLNEGTPSYNTIYNDTIKPMINKLESNPEDFLDDDEPSERLRELLEKFKSKEMTKDESLEQILIQSVKSVDKFLYNRITIRNNLKFIYNELKKLIDLDKYYQIKTIDLSFLNDILGNLY